MSGDKITLETVVVAREDLLASDLSDDELVMMDIDKGHYYGLEDVAKTIWTQLASARPVSEICAAVVAQFDADIESVEKDTIDFLTELHKENLINIQ